MPLNGSVHKGQRIYAVEYELDTQPKSYLIVWLDEHGNSESPINRPAQRGKRMVTVKPGDYLMDCAKRYKVAAVSVYRSLPV